MTAFYRCLAAAAAPALRLWIDHRVRRGKEDPVRRDERFGIVRRNRPPGVLLWMHAASVGESQSALALVKRLLASRADLSILFTTGTVSSARMLGERLPERAFHQFIPLDVPSWIGRFLDHWRPDAAIWIESEIWPNLVALTAERKIPMALVNARLSERSFRRWRAVTGLLAPPLSHFRPCLAQSAADAERLRALGAAQAADVGNLKFDGEPLPADMPALAALRRAMGDRPLWLAASTHPGEEEIIAAVHRSVRTASPCLLTMIVPRHAERGAELGERLSSLGLKVARRSQGETATEETDIYLGDTMGELGLFYRLTDIAFIGGSLVPHGGQNPLEAARLDCALLFGPHMMNFREIADALTAARGAIEVSDAESLAGSLAAYLGELPGRRQAAAAAAKVAAEGRGAVDRVLAELAPLLAAMPSMTPYGRHARSSA